MAMTDPIADMLSRIRNANSVYHDKVEIPASKIKIAIADVLKREGFIKDFRFADDNKQGILTVLLKFGPDREKVISGIQRISRPGLRQYTKRKDLPRVLGGLGIAIISTSQGIMSDKQAFFFLLTSARLCIMLANNFGGANYGNYWRTPLQSFCRLNRYQSR